MAGWLSGAVALAISAIPATGSARAATPLGVYSGGGAPASVAAFGDWLGEQPTLALDYLEWTSWSDIARPVWLLDQWEGQPYSLVLSVPMLPKDGSTLAEGAAGAFDHHFTELGENIVARGLGNSIIRLGWEFNHEWFPWYAGTDPASFVAYWHRIVDAMRAVEGADFTFEWSANLGGVVPLETVYPGDAYVDTIGLDVYNHDWNPGWEDPVTRWDNLRTKTYGLEWHRDFAAARGKPVTFPEWGMIVRSDGHGGGDDPYFVAQMHSWIEQGNTAFQIYFDLDTPETTNSMTNGWFPQGALRYRELFGSPGHDPQPVDTAGPPAGDTAPPAPSPSPDESPTPTPSPAPLDESVAPPPGPPQSDESVMLAPSPRPGIPAASASDLAAPITSLIVAAQAAAAGRASLDVRAIVRPRKGQLAISVVNRSAVPIRHIQVLVDGRRVCRSRLGVARCPNLSLSPGRHRFVLRVHETSRRKSAVTRIATVRSGIQKRLVLRI